MDVDITYCVPCEFLDRAIEVQRHLLETFGAQLDEVSLVTGDHGVFRVEAGDETLYDKHEHGEYDPDELARQLRTRL
jgi:selenoprotein W-related protein